MITIAAVIPNINDATSFYRAGVPLATMRKTYSNLNIALIPEFNLTTTLMCDIIFIQRPCTDNHLSLIKMAKDCGVKVWIDFDDDLFRVPETNPTYPYYSKKQTQKNIAMCTALADVVTVSTWQLQQHMKELNKNIKIIHNGFNFNLFKMDGMPPERFPCVLWRGSKTHEADLFEFKDQINALIGIYSKITFVFQGDCPVFISHNKNVIVCEGMEILDYHRHIKELRPIMTMVPLQDNDFNRCKSNIAFLESTYAGAITLAPYWPSWAHKGHMCYYNKPSQFYDMAKEILETYKQKEMEAHVTNSKTYIKKHLCLDLLNQKRAALVAELIPNELLIKRKDKV